MSTVARLLALLLVFVLTPGSTEIVENAVHLATDGHMAHAIDDADHTSEGGEHGCSGVIHSCGCHGSVSFLVMETDPRVSLAAPQSSSAHARAADTRVADGHRLGVYRPPAA